LARLKEDVMNVDTDGLPRRFAVGTHYIVEGGPDQNGKFRVTSRFLVFPDGRELHLRASTTGKHSRTIAIRQKALALRVRAARLRARARRKR
jgi:hypothetical protein